MTRRLIFLPALERHVTLGAYVAAVKAAKANPARTFRTGLTTWWPTTGAEIVAQFVAGLQDRINAGVPYHKRGSRMVAFDTVGGAMAVSPGTESRPAPRPQDVLAEAGTP